MPNATSAGATVLRGFRDTLKLVSGSSWSDRVFRKIAPINQARPYCIVDITSGGRLNETPTPDGEYLVRIECVANDIETAQVGDEVINNYLSIIELSAIQVAGSRWRITDMQEQGNEFLIVEQYAGEADIFRCGRFYLVRVYKDG